MPRSVEQFNTSQNLSPEKEEKFRRIYQGLERFGKEDFGIDSGIKDTVAYLNALDFNTVESCSGHLDHGSLAPRVGINAAEKPKWRFVGQKEAFEKAAQKYGVTLSEIFEYHKPGDERPPEERGIQPENAEQLETAWDEGWDSTPKEEETEEFRLWRKKTDELAERLNGFVQEFYKERSTTDNEKLVVDLNNDAELPHVYDYFLHNGGKDYLTMVDPDERAKLSEEEMNVLKKRLEANQKEMKDFTEFLKEKYRKE